MKHKQWVYTRTFEIWLTQAHARDKLSGGVAAKQANDLLGTCRTSYMMALLILQGRVGTCMYADIFMEVDGALATRSSVRYHSNALDPAHFGELPP